MSGNPAIPAGPSRAGRGPEALRPRLAAGLPMGTTIRRRLATGSARADGVAEL